METADNTVMHVTETKTLCSSPNCSKTTNEEITKEREEELLYGSNEDADEDALSEDSFRLTYSDEGEEQQTTDRDVASDVMKPPSTDMVSTKVGLLFAELGSNVPPSEMTERKNMLKKGNMKNGKIANEVEETKNKAESSSPDKSKITAEDMNGEIDEFRNGDSDGSVNSLSESSPVVNSSNEQWHYSGHFGRYSKQAQQHSVSKRPYASNVCNEKYYNQNAHYGRDKNCLRGFKLHNKTETRASIDPSLNDSHSEHTNAPSENERTNGCQISSKASDDDSTAASLDTNNSSGNKSITKVCETNEIQSSVESRISGAPEVLSNSENAGKTSDCTADADSTRGNNQQENDSSKCEKSSPTLQQDSNGANVRVDGEEHPVNNANDADVAGLESMDVDGDSIDLKATASVKISSNTTDKEEEPVADSINGQMANEAPEIATGSEHDGEETLENTRTNENGKNFTSETKKTLENGEITSLQTSDECADHEPGESEKSGDLKDPGNESEVKISKKHDEVVSENKIESNNAEIVLSGKVDEPVSENNEKEINVVCTSDVNSETDPVEELAKELNDESNIPESNDSKSIKTNQEANSNENKSEKQEEMIVQSPEPVTGVDLSNETKEKDSSTSSEKLDTLKSSNITKDCPIVAIDESRTNDGETNVPTAQKVTSELSISLTDREKKIISSGNNDDKESVDDGVTNEVATLRSSLKRTLQELLLDEMDLLKRMQMERKKNENTSESSVKENDSSRVSSGNVTEEIPISDKNIDTSNVENTVTNNNGENLISESEESTIIDNVVEKSSSGPRRNVEDKNVVRSDDHEADDDERIDDCEVIEVPAKRKQKRSRKSLNILRENSMSQDDSQEIENVRQRRKTAKNAEEMIRKECLANTDSESNDSLSKFVTISHKTNNLLRATSPPTLKRNYVDDEVKTEGTTNKKLKSDVTLNGDISMKSRSVESETKQTLHNVRQFFRRDANGSLGKLRQEELEELLIQKIVETITMRDEIGKLREQAKVSERNQEATRMKCQQLAKQIKDFDMVLSRYKSDLRSNPDSKTIVPIKINRSVGLQVNFVTDHGIQNLRQLQQAQKIIGGGTVNGTIAAHPQQQIQQPKQPAQQSAQPQGEPSTIPPGVRRTVKVRSPRRPENSTTAPVNSAVSTPVNSPHASTITPTALVVSKPVSESRPSVTTANQPVLHPQLLSSNQTILVNGNLTNQPIRQSPAMQASKTKNSDLIDLTQEEEKTKPPGTKTLTGTKNETSSNVPNVQKIAPRYHTVIQTIPGNMSITAQSGIRVVQPSSQPTPTALVNNMNAPRLAYVTMQSGMVPRQVVLTSTPTPIRPAPTNNIRTSFPIAGTINNSTVRVIPTTGAPPLLYKHPAALPESLNTMSSPSWKLPPPAPSLKISKVANGIVLSWNMALSDKYAEIASYQLYAYQEISGIAPSSSLWKKVGDVRALPLPMACTLTQFSEGNNYYFAVRAVDKHSRLGQYSQPGNISL